MWVKICGITSEEDALLAVAMGADALGFLFAPSPRQVAPSLVADIVKRLPPEILTIGVFRDHLPEQVADIVLAAGLKGAQLHGHETPEQAIAVRQRVPFVIKAFPAASPDVLVAQRWKADAVHIESANPGSGQVFDWNLASGVPGGTRLIVAGGLTPDNVAEAIRQTTPWGVDTSTGVEASPGRKDPTKVRTFIANAKAAAPEEYEPPADAPPLYDWMDDKL